MSPAHLGRERYLFLICVHPKRCHNFDKMVLKIREAHCEFCPLHRLGIFHISKAQGFEFVHRTLCTPLIPMTTVQCPATSPGYLKVPNGTHFTEAPE